MDIEFTAVNNEILIQMGWSLSNPNGHEKDDRYSWWHEMILPIMDEWIKFKNSELDSWWDRFTTSWTTIEAWQGRLLSLRQLAKQKFDIQTPEPQELTKTLWDIGGSGLGHLASFLKTTVYIVLALVGGYLIIKLISVGKASAATAGKVKVIGVGA